MRILTTNILVRILKCSDSIVYLLSHFFSSFVSHRMFSPCIFSVFLFCFFFLVPPSYSCLVYLSVSVVISASPCFYIFGHQPRTNLNRNKRQTLNHTYFTEQTYSLPLYFFFFCIPSLLVLPYQCVCLIICSIGVFPLISCSFVCVSSILHSPFNCK